LCSLKTLAIQENFRGHRSLRSQDDLTWTTLSGCCDVIHVKRFFKPTNALAMCMISDFHEKSHRVLVSYWWRMASN
jgi:hypothetical protein